MAKSLTKMEGWVLRWTHHDPSCPSYKKRTPAATPTSIDMGQPLTNNPTCPSSDLRPLLSRQPSVRVEPRRFVALTCPDIVQPHPDQVHLLKSEKRWAEIQHPVISSLGRVGCLRRRAAGECAQTEENDTSWRSATVEMFPEPFSPAVRVVTRAVRARKEP